MIEAHRASLSQRHAQLEVRIATETRRPLPDMQLIRELKREKLRLKDELSGHARH